jgi:hypothetical protein
VLPKGWGVYGHKQAAEAEEEGCEDLVGDHAARMSCADINMTNEPGRRGSRPPRGSQGGLLLGEVTCMDPCVLPGPAMKLLVAAGVVGTCLPMAAGFQVGVL